jgi:hypothetical protein
VGLTGSKFHFLISENICWSPSNLFLPCAPPGHPPPVSIPVTAGILMTGNKTQKCIDAKRNEIPTHNFLVKLYSIKVTEVYSDSCAYCHSRNFLGCLYIRGGTNSLNFLGCLYIRGGTNSLNFLGSLCNRRDKLIQGLFFSKIAAYKRLIQGLDFLVCNTHTVAAAPPPPARSGRSRAPRQVS